MDQKIFICFCDYFDNAFQKIVSEVTDVQFIQDENETVQNCIGGKKLSSIVRVVGLYKGRIHIEMHVDLARRLYEYSNGEPPQDEMDLCFYLAEFTNVVAGNGITALNNIYKSNNLRLMPPAIFADENLEIIIPQFLSAKKTYSTKYGAVLIEIGFEGW